MLAGLGVDSFGSRKLFPKNLETGIRERRKRCLVSAAG